MSRQKNAVVLGILLSVLVVTGVIVVMLLRPADERPGSSEPTFTREIADGISVALLSGDVDQVSAVVALPPDVAVPQEFADQMQAYSDLTFDSATFVDHSDGTGHVQAAVTGEEAGITSWIAHMVLDEDRWKLSATVVAP